MDQFIKLLPDEKSVTCLDDLLSLKVSELIKILCSYNEKVSGNKADLVLRTYAVFSRAKEGSSAALSRCTDSSICKYHEMYSLKCGHLPWVSDLRGTPPFTFVQLYDYLVLRTSRYKHIFLKQTGYKKIKSFKFFYEGFIRKILVAKDGDHTFFDVRMKASMKNTLYKVLVVLDSSGNVSSAACTYPAASRLCGFGNCTQIGGVLFALEDFNRKGLHQSKECHEYSEESMAFNDCYDISSPNFKEIIDVYFKSMHSMTQEEIDLIQNLTIGQSSNGNWLKYRAYRLTASNFYSAAVNRVEPSSKLNSYVLLKIFFSIC